MMSKRAQRPIKRLRWKVLSRFGILPGGLMDALVSNRRVILCAQNMLMDMGTEPEEQLENPEFDRVRFERLGEGK